MILKSLRRAQSEISRQQQIVRKGRKIAHAVPTGMEWLASMQLDELVSLSIAYLSGWKHEDISRTFGVDVECAGTFTSIFNRHVEKRVEDAAQILRRLQRLDTPGRHACRRLFDAISGCVEPITPSKSADFRLWLETVNGLSPPEAWPYEAKATVFRLVAVARAGVSYLEEHPLPVKAGGSVKVTISWRPDHDGLDLDKCVIPIITLALLRARALCRLKAMLSARH